MPTSNPQEKDAGTYSNEFNGHPLKIAARRCGFTLASLAKHIGVSMSCVEKWSRGVRRIPPQRRRQLARIFAKGPRDVVGMDTARSVKRKPSSTHAEVAPAYHGPCLGCDGNPQRYERIVGEPCCACRGSGRRPKGSPPVQGVRGYSLMAGEVGE